MSNRAFFCTNIYWDFNFILYFAVPPCDTQLPSETLFVTTIYTYIFKGSCVSQGGTVSFKKKIEISIYSNKEIPW